MIKIIITNTDQVAYILALLTENAVTIQDICSAPLVPYGFSDPVTTLTCSNCALDHRHVLELLGADIITS